MYNLLINNLIWRQSPLLLSALLLASLVGYLLYMPLMVIGFILILFCIYFFRNPERTFENKNDEKLIIAPADGKIIEISQSKATQMDGYKISIFLSPFDVHVNWIPVWGTIQKINYVQGRFMPAYLLKSSELNEHNDLIIKTPYGIVLVRQIAGFIARRIVCWIKTESSVQAGQKFGMIKFGSRVDLFLPKNIVFKVKKGQKVYGGQTVIGKFI